MNFQQGVLVKLKDTTEIDCGIEDYILAMYEEFIRNIVKSTHRGILYRILYDKNNNYDIDIIAGEDMWRGMVIERFHLSSSVLCILDEELRNKYAAYIWKDCFIFNSFGMMLNNSDDKHPANCIWNWNKKGCPEIITAHNIKKGEALRIDYGYKDNYPPIPKEIIDIRKRYLSCYDEKR